MTKEISSLIDCSLNVMTYLGIHEFTFRLLDGCTYVEMAVDAISDLPTFLKICTDYNVRIYAENEQMIILISMKE